MSKAYSISTVFLVICGFQQPETHKIIVKKSLKELGTLKLYHCTAYIVTQNTCSREKLD